MNEKHHVGFLYDSAVLDHQTPPGHPERPSRISNTMQLLEKSGILERLQRLPITAATRAQIERVHSVSYLNRVEQIAAGGGGYLDAGDTVASAGSWHAAVIAAGAAVSAIDAVLSGHIDSAFALIRPPGHHATPSAAMGFCILNHAAIAAAHACAAYGLQRVLLIDFDVHHGNGTQDAFYSDPKVLYFSTHQFPAYPGTGRLEETGSGPGQGFTVNIPMPARVEDAGFLRAFETVLMPVAERYRPELVLLSAGYDAHWRNSAYVAGIDERMTVTGLASLAGIVKSIADTYCSGRLVGVLEGGYDLEALGYGVLATLQVWLGGTQIIDPIGPPPDSRTAPDIRPLLESVRQIHAL